MRLPQRGQSTAWQNNIDLDANSARCDVPSSYGASFREEDLSRTHYPSARAAKCHVLTPEVSFDWKINDLSDGQRRRCQLLEILCVPRPVYLMDEITSDLDIFAREGILNFLRSESETRGATIFYCTHIFDHLEGWASHLLHMAKGQVVKACRT